MQNRLCVLDINMTKRQSLLYCIVKGKIIRELIVDLQSFENQDFKVEISTDSGKSRRPISMVIKRDTLCLLVNYED